jgi:hypothetical protein
MSHFSVLVAAKDEKELGQRLAPFQENNEEYLEWVDRTDSVLEDYEQRLELSDLNFTEDITLSEFNKKWGEYTEYEPGKFGYQENPNRKWDWWTIGGRWAGAIFWEAMATPDFVAMRCSDMDSVLVGEVDFGCLRERSAGRAMREWDNWFGYAKWYIRGCPLSYEKTREIARAIDANFYYFYYDAVPGAYDAKWFVPMGLTRKQHVQAAYDKSLTFAFVDMEGNWVEQGNMGWWACVTNEDDNYDAKFWAFIESLSPEQRLYVVDCHI